MLHKHEPVTKKEMNWISPNNSICQVLREIYHNSTDETVKKNCRVAVSMAKSMTKKLKDYKEDWESDFWDENPNFKPFINQIKTGKAKVRVVE